MNEATCPECRTALDANLIRCPKCHAYIHDVSPWRSDYALIILPASLVFWFLIDMTLRYDDFVTSVYLQDPISRGILAVGIYGFFILAVKHIVTLKQRKAFLLIRALCAGERDITSQTLDQARRAISQAGLGAYNRYIAYNRLRWIYSMQQSEEQDHQLMLTTMKQSSDTDWDSIESSYTFTQFIIWLLPTAGFMGTVYGMTLALKSFSATVGSSSKLNLSAGLTETVQNLGIAFHTTLIGVIVVIPVLALSTVTRRMARQLLESEEKYFLQLSNQIISGGVHHGAPALEPQQEVTNHTASLDPEPDSEPSFSDDKIIENHESVASEQSEGESDQPSFMNDSEEDGSAQPQLFE